MCLPGSLASEWGLALRALILLGADIRSGRLAGLLLIACLQFGAQAHSAEDVVLILSDRAPAYEEAAEAFASRFGDLRSLRIVQADALNAAAVQSLGREAGLIVPVGLKATRLVADNYAGEAAVLALMVPRSGFEGLDWPSALNRRKLSAVFIDQPPARSLGLIEKALPQARTVGVIHSEEGQSSAALLLQEAKHHRLGIRTATVRKFNEVAPSLRQLLPESDVLLLIPDALVVNANNVQHVLLTTYRYRVPVVGFSQGLVKAGAVAAVYSTPTQIGRQGAEIARLWSTGPGELPAPRHCGEFSVAFNQHVARSLGLDLPDEQAVRARLGAAP